MTTPILHDCSKILYYEHNHNFAEDTANNDHSWQFHTDKGLKFHMEIPNENVNDPVLLEKYHKLVIDAIESCISEDL